MEYLDISPMSNLDFAKNGRKVNIVGILLGVDKNWTIHRCQILDIVKKWTNGKLLRKIGHFIDVRFGHCKKLDEW
nr:MAG: hypothetical protein [Marsupenaeus japonicus endogenous nimavirus]